MTAINLVLLIIGIPIAIAIGICFIIQAQKVSYINKIIMFENASKRLPVTKENFDLLSRDYDDILRNNCDYKRTKKAYVQFIERFRSQLP